MTNPEKIAIVGAGLMGHGLALVFAEKGHPVWLVDNNAAALEAVRELWEPETTARNIRLLAEVRRRRGKDWLMSAGSNIAMSVTWPFATSYRQLHLLPFLKVLP